MDRLVYFVRDAVAVISAFGLLSADPSAVDGAAPRVLIEKTSGSTSVRVVEYEEQYRDFTSGKSDLLWRTVFCVEVESKNAVAPNRVWHGVLSTGRLGQSFAPSTLSLSDPNNGRCVLAFCVFNAVYVGLIDLEGSNGPPPTDMTINAATGLPNWSNPKLLIIPDPMGGPTQPAALRSLGKAEIGIDLVAGQEIRLKSISKTDRGWKIEATVYELFNPETQRFDHIPVIRFAMLLDEECKSATFAERRVGTVE